MVIHRPPARLPKRNDRLWFHRRARWRRVAIAQAAVAADDRAVTVIGGANVIRQLPEARLVDELRIDVMPVMLGRGRRPLDGIDPQLVALERLGVEEVGERPTLIRTPWALRAEVDDAGGVAAEPLAIPPERSMHLDVRTDVDEVAHVEVN